MNHPPVSSDSARDGAPHPEPRGRYVARMFDRIAARYDRMNRLMSLGQDQRWRQRMADLALVPRGGLVLDLATGTGDVALAVLAAHPTSRVIGADFALQMMRAGQPKLARAPHLDFVGADALALPFAAETFDAVLHAFLMRNIESIPAGFAEQWRVLKPGGRMVGLEIIGPQAPLVRQAYRLFFEELVPQVGAWIAGDSEAYRYLPQSVRRFPPPDTVSLLLREAGFREVRYEYAMLGSIAIHVACKPMPF